jgi:hypothetical protein
MDYFNTFVLFVGLKGGFQACRLGLGELEEKVGACRPEAAQEVRAREQSAARDDGVEPFVCRHVPVLPLTREASMQRPFGSLVHAPHAGRAPSRST